MHLQINQKSSSCGYNSCSIFQPKASANMIQSLHNCNMSSAISSNPATPRMHLQNHTQWTDAAPEEALLNQWRMKLQCIYVGWPYRNQN
jgi:hypothetical protein